MAIVLSSAPSANAIQVFTLDDSGFRFVVEQTGAQFGSAVAGAPGLRDSGETRLVAGGMLWDNGALDAGFASVHEPQTTPGEWGALTGEWVLTSGTAGDRLGSTLAGGGDVNDDGINDVAIGGWSIDVGSLFDAGTVFVRFGAADVPTPTNQIPNGTDLVIEGEAGADHFGFSVCIDGDVNGDGIADIVVGSPLGQGTGISNGEVFVYFGGSHLTTGTVLTTADADVHFVGDEDDAGVGHVVVTGNINGDAFDDLVIGAPSASPQSRFRAGAAYVFLGRAYASGATFVVDTDFDVEIRGATSNDACASSAAVIDLDGDGLGEILIGAPFANVGGEEFAGRVYILRGAPISVGALIEIETGTDADRTINGDAPGDLFGWAIANAGDMNRDLAPDLVVGAPGVDYLGRSGVGAAYLDLSVPGELPSDGRAANVMDRAYVGVNAGDEAGTSVAGLGDFNLDGGMDLAVGAPGYDPAGVESGGGVFVFTGATAVAVPDPAAGGAYMVGAPVPNPSVGSISVLLYVPSGDRVRATVLDVAGRFVRTLAAGVTGTGVIGWDGRDERGLEVEAGVYFLAVDGASGRQTARVVVAR